MAEYIESTKLQDISTWLKNAKPKELYDSSVVTFKIAQVLPGDAIWLPLGHVFIEKALNSHSVTLKIPSMMFDADARDDFLLLVNQLPVKPTLSALQLFMTNLKLLAPRDCEDDDVQPTPVGQAEVQVKQEVPDVGEHDDLAITEEDLLAFTFGSRQLPVDSWDDMKRIVDGCKSHMFERFLEWKGITETWAEAYTAQWGMSRDSGLADVKKDIDEYLKFLHGLFKKQRSDDPDDEQTGRRTGDTGTKNVTIQVQGSQDELQTTNSIEENKQPNETEHEEKPKETKQDNEIEDDAEKTRKRKEMEPEETNEPKDEKSKDRETMEPEETNEPKETETDHEKSKDRKTMEAENTEERNEMEPEETKNRQKMEAEKTEERNDMEAEETKNRQEMEAEKTEERTEMEPEETEERKEMEPGETEERKEMEPGETEERKEMEPGEIKERKEMEPEEIKEHKEKIHGDGDDKSEPKKHDRLTEEKAILNRMTLRGEGGLYLA